MVEREDSKTISETIWSAIVGGNTSCESKVDGKSVLGQESHGGNEKISILTASYGDGQRKRGVEKGPDAILEAGLVDLLNSNHVQVIQCPQYPSDRPEYQTDSGILKKPLAVSYNTQYLYQATLRALGDRRPCFAVETCSKATKSVVTAATASKIITLGGDHSIAMGSIAAIAQKYPDVAVLWIDAHADLNTPKTTVSGNLHGCPVAFLLQLEDCRHERGFEWMRQEAEKLCGTGAAGGSGNAMGHGPDSHPSFLTPGRIAYLGLRDVEAGEMRMMRQMDIPAAFMSDIARCPEGILGCLSKLLQKIDPHANRPLYISFDIDAIDPRWAPSTGTPVERGISLAEALDVCRALRSTKRVIGMDLVEVNPEIGSPSDRELTISSAIKIITTLMGSRNEEDGGRHDSEDDNDVIMHMDEDENTETDTESEEEATDFTENSEDSEQDASQQFDFISQLQSALLSSGGFLNTATSPQDLERLRQSINQMAAMAAGGAGMMNSSALNQLQQIIRTLNESPSSASGNTSKVSQMSKASINSTLSTSLAPSHYAPDPIYLYSLLTQVWELIVLVGEELDTYEFDSRIDLRPLLNHLLRVIRWEEDDCQVLGGDFLLIAVRCIRGIIQYSPQCTKRLVEANLVPLLTRHLFSVEYIDLAEDLIHIIFLLSRNGTYVKACLTADGIRAVLGMVDFFALHVQVTAFTAAAQISSAFLDTSLAQNSNGTLLILYLPDDLISMLKSRLMAVTASITTNSADESIESVRIIRQILVIFQNSLKASSSSNDSQYAQNTLIPVDFMEQCLIPLATSGSSHQSFSSFALDLARLFLSLIHHPGLPAHHQFLASTHQQAIPLFRAFFGHLERSFDDALLDTILSILLEFFCATTEMAKSDAQMSALPAWKLLGFKAPSLISRIKQSLKATPSDSLLLDLDQVILTPFIERVSLPPIAKYSFLATWFLGNQLHAKLFSSNIQLEKMGVWAQMLASTDTFIEIIALEWLHFISGLQTCTFQVLADRQGISYELHRLPARTENSLGALTASSMAYNDSALSSWLCARLKDAFDEASAPDEENVGSPAITAAIKEKYLKTAAARLSARFDDDAVVQNTTTKPSTFHELVVALHQNPDAFTEFEMLGNPQDSLVKRALDSLVSASPAALALSKEDCELLFRIVNRALNRYDDQFFQLHLPPTNLQRPLGFRNPFDSLAILSRPLRLLIKISQNDSSSDASDQDNLQEKLLICDPFATLALLMKIVCGTDAERRALQQPNSSNAIVANLFRGESSDGDDSDGDANGRNANSSSTTSLIDTLHPPSQRQLALSSISTNSWQNWKISLLIRNGAGSAAHQRIPLPAKTFASSTILQVLFNHLLKGSPEDRWRKLTEIWSSSPSASTSAAAGGNFHFLIEKSSEPQTIVPGPTSSFPPQSSDRVKTALDFLAALPFKIQNDRLAGKLVKELQSPLVQAVGSISPCWISTAQSYHFLFPFSLRVTLMQSTCLGPLRALWLLSQRLADASNGNNNNNNATNAPNPLANEDNNSLSSNFALPRRKFQVNRSQLIPAMRILFAAPLASDSRLFEFEYVGELGTGHGPTLEFYSLASKEFLRASHRLFHQRNSASDAPDEAILNPEGLGLFPNWAELDDDGSRREMFTLMGAFVARAWLDDRTINLPLHPIFVKSLLKNEEMDDLTLDDLNEIDPELAQSVFFTSIDELISAQLPANVPGTEIPLIMDGSVVLTTEKEVMRFRDALLRHISRFMQNAATAFLSGFHGVFPTAFSQAASFFDSRLELGRLFSPAFQEDSSLWTPSSILSALITDHGYRGDSPQIRWLAEVMSEAESHCDRARLMQFLAGSAYLPIGGWKALRPPLTIVCKTFDSPAAAGTAASASSLSSLSENHDIYLPSVMTCANYLKLPRYTSKDILRERLWYAIRESNESFYLS